MRKQTLLAALLAASVGMTAKNCSEISGEWKFTQNGESTIVTLPHTWNALDGQDGGDNYFRGKGEYTRIERIPESWGDSVVYLKVGAANSEATVYLNGDSIGNHVGGYSAFMIDVTGKLKAGEDNEIRIVVNNGADVICPPLSADFTFYGGISRPVSWVVCAEQHINPNGRIVETTMPSWLRMSPDYRVTQPGVRVMQLDVNAERAELKYCVDIRNAASEAVDVMVEMSIQQADGTEVWRNVLKSQLPAGLENEFEQNCSIDRPHLWNGLNDPYLYKVLTRIFVDDKVVDSSVEPLGLRSIRIDSNEGFILNGKSYPLHGICLHEEKKDHGRAVSDADRREAVDILRETGMNYLRLSHYQHGDFTYAYLDTLGICCWAEIPAVNSVGLSEEQNAIYRRNAVTQMYELVRQQYNHPSIVVWGLANEINYKQGINTVATVNQINEVVKSEDRHRPTVTAAMYPENPSNFIADAYSCNRYDGWYYGTIDMFGTEMDRFHSKYPNKCIGVSEYGVGANVGQHQIGTDKPVEGGQFHPEEYQSYFHEEYWKMISARPSIWESSVWAGYDFASDNRDEGSQPGINDKGLVTFDRKVRKDAFYFYKAVWNTNDAFVYITSRRNTKRTDAAQRIRIYSNQKEVEMMLNGKSIGKAEIVGGIASFDITLRKGKNTVKVMAGDGITDEVVLILAKK